MGATLIRAATEEDWPGLMPLLLAYHEECGLAPLAIDKVEATVSDAIKRSLMLVAEEEGELVGAFGIAESAPWYSDEPFFGDFCHYVVPKARGNGVEKRLANAAIAIVDALDGMLFVSRIDPARMKKRGKIAEIEFFQSAGYTSRLR